MEDIFEKLPEKISLKGVLNFRGENAVWVNGKKISPKRSLAVRNKSSTGFSWGYGGSGPAQLALAVLLLYWLPVDAEDYFQDFKASCIAGLPQTDFIQDIELRRILLEIDLKRHKLA